MGGGSLAINIRNILSECETAARGAGRDPHQVRVIAVSKGVDGSAVRQAIALGLNLFGENYVQEWLDKVEALDLDHPRWHFIGALQSNKAKAVVGNVELIHSLDRDSLAEVVNRVARDRGMRQKMLIEVNLAGEESKSGVLEKDLKDKMLWWRELPNLDLCGLMVMPPLGKDAESSRPYFRRAREHFEKLRELANDHSWNELSMGTTQDYQVAIAEGSTLVRVGTAIFGPRKT